MNKKAMICINNNCYTAEDGSTLQREYGETPNGNHLCGKWVYRCNGEFMGFDKYRNDLAERFKLNLI